MLFSPNNSQLIFCSFSYGARTGSSHRRRTFPSELPRLHSDRLRGTAHQIYADDAGRRGRFSHQGDF